MGPLNVAKMAAAAASAAGAGAAALPLPLAREGSAAAPEAGINGGDGAGMGGAIFDYGNTR